MDITKIDANFKIKNAECGEVAVYELPNDAITVKGCYFDERQGFIKMPPEVTAKISEGVAWGARCTVGARALFSTDSKILELNVRFFAKCLMGHMAFTGSAGFSLFECENGKEKLVANAIPPFGDESEWTASIALKGGKIRDYVLYFPLYSGVEKLSLGFSVGSEVRPFDRYKPLKPVLYYGSSITQGACATRPDTCYQSSVARKINADYYVLGFSGSAKAEPDMMEFLKNFECSLFICDYDHNAPDAEYLARTHLPLYKKFRENPAHKNVPIVFISKPDGFRDENAAARFAIIKQTYDYAKSAGDADVYLIDGRNLYPDEWAESCLVDGCHPTDLGFYFMANALLEVIEKNSLI